MTATDVDAHDEAAGWIESAATGDRAAFEALYRAKSGLLLAICLRVLGDREAAEDVVQEVWVSIWHKAAQFDRSRARASTWLGAIARHRAIDRLRAQPDVQRADIDLATLDDPAPGPATTADAHAGHARLDDCIGRLEPKRRSLIRFAFFEGETYEALAQRTGHPLGSVKSWIRRGLQQLRSCLEAAA